MSICPKCQSQNRDGASACRICGSPLSVAGGGPRMCPSGRHPMDPSWSECPYCRNAGGVPVNSPSHRPPTMVESDSGSGGRRRTMMEEGAGPAPISPPKPGGGRRGPTKFMAEGDAPSTGSEGQPKPAPAAVRKVVAVMVTYSWKPEGQVFAVYEGRNHIGSAPECEVSLASDPQMSSKHATIIYRAGAFMLDDAGSMNGTFLEELDVLEKARVHNYSHLRTGATQWIFIIIQPESASAAE